MESSKTDDIIKTLVYNKKDKDSARGMERAVEKRILAKKILRHRRKQLKEMLDNVKVYY